MGRLLQIAWEEQREYNSLIASVQTENESRWDAVYALGLSGTIDGISEAMGWKRHRKGSAPSYQKRKLAHQLANATKYLLSLWQHFGFSELDMLLALSHRHEELMLELNHDYFPPSGKDVIVFDLDGTVADWRAGFASWLGREDKVSTLHIDVDNNIPFDEYEKAKAEFETSGGYLSLQSYDDAVLLLRREADAGSFLFCTTARPVDRFEEVRRDTLQWLQNHGIFPSAIIFGSDERIIELLKLNKRNRIVLLEDNPSLAERAARNGIAVMLRDQPYNKTVSAHNIIRYTKFPWRVEWGEFEERFLAASIENYREGGAEDYNYMLDDLNYDAARERSR